MGALKNRFQCLRGLWIKIKSGDDGKSHRNVCDWIVCCLILHNLVIDVEGTAVDEHLQPDPYIHHVEQVQPQEEHKDVELEEKVKGEAKRQRLKAEIIRA